MTIEQSDRTCPNCEATLQVVYQTELKQVASGWSCPECGFVESEKHHFTATVPLPEDKEYVLRIEKPLTSEDVRDPINDVEDEFRALASSMMNTDEVWTLLDPEAGEVVEVLRGRRVVRAQRARDEEGEAD